MSFSDEIKKIIDLKVDRLESIPDAFSSRMVAIQRSKFNDVIRLLDDLDYSNGLIVVNDANILKIEAIVESIKDVLTGQEYELAVGELMSEFDNQAAITYKYFTALDPRFEIPSISNTIIRSKKNEAILSLLNSTDQYLTNPMRQSLSNSVLAGGSRFDLIATFRDLIEGDPEKVGRLERATRQIVSDTFALSDRAVTNEIAEQLGFEYYLYTGGLLKTTRPFCKSRNGKFFKKSEVEMWGALDSWDGRMEGTDSKTIFQTAGGYNCQHSILPVSEGVVPDEVRNRNAFGNTALKTPDVKFGAGKLYDDYAKGIRKESLIAIDRLPKPYEIKSKGISEGSYYKPSLNLSDGKAGTLVVTSNRGKRVFLHEYGHHIDYSISQNAYKGIRYQRSMDKDFLNARKADIAHLNDKFKGKNMFDELSAKWETDLDFKGASDMFDSLTGGVAYDKYHMQGHGARYYNRKGSKYNMINRSNQQTESFANLFEAYSNGGNSWANIVEHFPNQAGVFETMMKNFVNE